MSKPPLAAKPLTEWIEFAGIAGDGSGPLFRPGKSAPVTYQHIPALGIRSDKRQNLDRPGAREQLFNDYEATTLKTESAAIDSVVKLVKQKPNQCELPLGRR